MEIGGLFSGTFGGTGGVALSSSEMEGVAIGSPTPPELSGAGGVAQLDRTATILFWVATAYLVVFVFHIVTY